MVLRPWSVETVLVGIALRLSAMLAAEQVFGVDVFT